MYTGMMLCINLHGILCTSSPFVPGEGCDGIKLSDQALAMLLGPRDSTV